MDSPGCRRVSERHYGELAWESAIFDGVVLTFRMVDWSLQMAHYNFSQALMHVGGQNVYYNVSRPVLEAPGSSR